MKKTKIIWYLMTFLPVVLIVLGYIYPNTFNFNREFLQNYINSFGTLAPLVFITIQALQVIITPLNHYIIGILGGFLFGVWPGFLYNWIGRIIGSAIAFYIGRKFGRKILTKVIREENLKKYD